MNSTSIPRSGALVLLGCLYLIGTPNRAAFAIENLKVGEAFPDFSLPRADGVAEPHGLKQLGGKPAVVVFWRPRQQLSLEALRDLQAVIEELGVDRFAVAAVDSAHSTAQDAQTALKGETLSFPILLDPQRELYGRIGVIVSPTTLVVDATGKLRFVLASHPRTYRQVIRARLRYLLGDIDEEQMKKDVEPTVFKIDQELAAAWRMYNLGRKLRAEGKSSEAMSLFENAVSTYPSLSEARCALGFMKFSEGDLESAARHFQTALVHSPTSTLARLGKAVVLGRTGQPDQAESILLSLLGQRPIAARVRYELGRIYQARGEIGRAITFFQDALEVVFPEPPRPGGEGPSPAVVTTPSPKPPELASHPGAAAAPSTAAAPTGGVTQPTVEPIVPPPDAQYIGVKSCKKCHFQQWRSWQETKMAKAFDLLRPGVRAEVKLARKLDPQMDYSADATCLACHTTGFGFPGGYPKDPPGDARAAAAALERASVGCEACHGPGHNYSQVHKEIQDARRKYTRKELLDAGQYESSAAVCAACHNQKGPCIAPGVVFDFQQRKDKGTHKHYDLQFRSD